MASTDAGGTTRSGDAFEVFDDYGDDNTAEEVDGGVVGFVVTDEEHGDGDGDEGRHGGDRAVRCYIAPWWHCDAPGRLRRTACFRGIARPLVDRISCSHCQVFMMRGFMSDRGLTHVVLSSSAKVGIAELSCCIFSRGVISCRDVDVFDFGELVGPELRSEISKLFAAGRCDRTSKTWSEGRDVVNIFVR